ncbi:MAG: MmcQ/YjbR family DNA-binding protein [Caulobacter sp.]|nr:MmcQ/YjbR family DNA-binding protein [Caulobacter sp.]
MESRLRACALSLPGVHETAVLETRVFKVRGKAFATEGWPEAGWAVVKLSPQDQKRLVAGSIALAPEPGPRGKKGVTLIRLKGADDDLISEVLVAGWQAVYGGERRPRDSQLRARIDAALGADRD